MILIVDNYDSFTYNLVDMIARQEEVIVKYPDDPTIYNLDVEALVISPGPGHPMDTTHLEHIIEHYHHKPILGVCLGSQALTCYYGGDVIQCENIKHGKKDQMKIVDETLLYKDIPEYSEIMRYHSLMSNPDTFPESLKVTAQTKDCIQSFEHKTNLHFGIQFHPESFATEYGTQMINNFLTVMKEVRDNGATNTVETT
ncbi:glutamine amidotransferase [Staphylococcus succinus]|uniref:Aminodeoxychorismate/anthranilate synthase component II n=1 Tax=Staphylococcus succinus TaxID=61015 RepID=A0A9Q6HMD8_9STAP|nr:aminodeoxychorismate/anthranilate synthase component II [Staphylococcus succinus]MBU0437570.1 aminodeoxychorismate/anthranilate synthase component II [Staphylococcus succinus]MEB7461542.1 aminodeoxychorismate/anthranilate synthase component II [Staphylococcus succinus]PKI23136.1 glutamine amidotransferase [Staphylococcus succinus]PTI41702.1 aminodeoxychorismate/anthranilate synthase component II [Staphylococcus succinus]PTI46835.1 aminodeoxychorismate/anthranilate synthase component II [Sta